MILRGQWVKTLGAIVGGDELRWLLNQCAKHWLIYIINPDPQGQLQSGMGNNIIDSLSDMLEEVGLDQTEKYTTHMSLPSNL